MFRKHKVILSSFIVAALILGIVGVGAVMADELNGNSDGIIRAAYQKVNGMLRILSDDEEPRPSEEYIEWSVMGPAGPEGPPGPAVEQHIGTKVGPGLYEVHTRVLWDVGWLRDEGHGYIEGGVFVLHSYPRNLAVGNGMETFLGPLRGYGIPEVQEGATRKVRLYVNYGHQLDMGGTPTIMIGDVEFYLPQVGGHYVAPAANWSNFRSYDEYQHVGHAPIAVWVKDSLIPPWPTQGTMYRIEAHFYDEFPE